MKKLVLSSSLAFAAAASAQTAPFTIWQDLTLGMTKDEVSQIYPSGKVALTSQCEAKVNGRFSNGRLAGVVLKFGDLMGGGRERWNQAFKCQEIVRTSILHRYGEPDSVGRRIDPVKGSETGDKFVWIKDDLIIEFYAQDKRPFTVVEYRYAPEPLETAPTAPDAANKL